MPDRIDAKTRAMIDAKLAELGDKVRRPPDPRLEPAPLGRPAAPSPAPRRRGRGPGPSPLVQARIAEVAERLERGESPGQIAAAMGLKRTQVDYAVKQAMARRPGLRAPLSRSERRRARHAAILEALRAGRSREDIRRELGVAAITLAADIKALLDEHPDLAALMPRRGRPPKPES